MMIPTPEMIEAAIEAYREGTYLDDERVFASVNAIVAAALALLPGEAVAVWRKFENGNNYLDIRDKELFASSNEIELFASTPAPLPVAVKGLEWEHLGGDFHRAKAPLFGNIRIENYGGSEFIVTYSIPGYSDTFTPGKFASADEAKAAAQADYETRIRSALLGIE